MSDIPTVAIERKDAKHGYAIVNAHEVPEGAKVLTDAQLERLKKAAEKKAG